MSLIRIQTVMQGNSNLAEDRYVTNTQWEGPSAVWEDDAEQAFTHLTAFWTSIETAGGSIGHYIPGFVNRTIEFRAYNLLVPEGQRTPYIGTALMPASNSPSAMPSEVACVLSFVGGAPPFGPGDRNRFFVGPLTVDAKTTDSSSPARVAPVFQLLLATQAEDMRADSQLSGVEWVTVSRVLDKTERSVALVQPVVGGWVDDAFDTVRSRGEDATNREGWGVLQA